MSVIFLKASRVIGLLCLTASVVLIWWLSKSVWSISGREFMAIGMYVLVPLFILLLNLSATYKLLVKKNNDRWKSAGIIAIFMTISPILFFIAWEFAAVPILPLICLVLLLTTFVLVRLVDTRLAMVITVLMSIILGFAIFVGFEEGYCVRKGDIAPDSGLLYEDLNEKERRFVGGGGEGAKISGYLRVHLKYHDDFKFSSALREIYFGSTAR